MVLGMVTGSMPMLFSLLLMQGITLTMWRSFLDKAIPRYNTEKWRKNIEQAIIGTATGGVPTPSSQVDPSSIQGLLQSSPDQSSVANSPSVDPVANSLQILSKLDPNMLKLLSQMNNKPNQSPQQNSIPSQQLLNSPINSPPQMGLQNSPSMYDNNELSTMMPPYVQYTPVNDDPNQIKYIEVSSHNAQQQPQYIEQQPHYIDQQSQYMDPQSQYVDPQSQYVAPQSQYVDPQSQYVDPQSQYVDPQSQYVSQQQPMMYQQYQQPYEMQRPQLETNSHIQSNYQSGKAVPEQGRYEYVEVEATPETASAEDEEEEPKEDEEETESESETEDDREAQQDDNEEGENMPQVIIGPPIKGTALSKSRKRLAASSERYLRYIKWKKKPKRMFGKPRLTKRMLRFDSNPSPIHHVQNQLKRRFFNPFRSLSSFARNFRPLSWKRTSSSSVSTGRNFRFVTPSIPMVFRSNFNMSSQDQDRLNSIESVEKRTYAKLEKNNVAQNEFVSVVMSNKKKDLKLKSNKIKLIDIDEVKNNCSANEPSKGKFNVLWSQSSGWKQQDKGTDCNSASTPFDTIQLQLTKGMGSNSLTTTISPLTTQRESSIEPATVSSSSISPTTSAPQVLSTTSLSTTEVTTLRTTSTIDMSAIPSPIVPTTMMPIPNSLLLNFQYFLSSLSTASPIVNLPTTSTTTPSPPTTTTTTESSIISTEKSFPNEMSKEFLYYILMAMNASKIDDFQMNSPHATNNYLNSLVPAKQIPNKLDQTSVFNIKPVVGEREENNRNEEGYQSGDNEDDDEVEFDNGANWDNEDKENRVDGKILVRHRFKRICYYLLNGGRDGQLDIAQLELHICSHLIVGYARISTSGMVAAQKPLEDSEKYRRLTLMKLQYPNLKVLLSIGDLGGTLFSIVASTNRTRERFVFSVLDFCREFNFDGVDIDWEFPGLRTGSVDDKRNFILLLKELRERSDQIWKRKTKKGNRSKFIISVAVGAPLVIASTSYIIPDISRFVDFVNLMSYDFHYYRADRPYTGHHAPLYPRSTEQAYYSTLNVAWTATYWANSGMPLAKIIVGVPTYARTYSLVVPIGQNMINAPATGPGIGRGKINYTHVCDFLKKPQTVKQFDLYSQVPYAYKDFDWVAYENEMSVAIKAQWVIKTGMGGIVTFALNFDDVKGTCRDDGKKFPLQKTISNLLELASIKSYKQSLYVMKVRGGSLDSK